MRIQNSFISQKTDQTGEVSTHRTAAPQAGTPVPAADQPGEHIPAPEVQQLTALVQQEPEVRENRVTEVAQRLADGTYLTRAAALQTADALSAAPD